MLTRNLVLLTFCQFLSVSGTVLILTLGGIIGATLSPDPALATLPISAMIVGTAAATVFAALLMARIGRRLGFIAGAGIALLGAALAALALAHRVPSGFEFALFCVGLGLIGANTAFVQQYRFAAAESVVPERAGSAIATILVGSIFGALFGPYLATLPVLDAHAAPQAAQFLPIIGALALLQCLIALVLTQLRAPAPIAVAAAHAEARPFRQVLAQPRFIVAVLGGMIGYGTMSLIMTATPLSMHLLHGFSVVDTASVIRAHVLAMYLPSLASAALIAWLGVPRLMWIGVAAIAGTVAIGLQGHAMLHYWWALVLLGVGWNFLFVGGTALLMQTYRDSEKYAAQAVNEFSVFGASAAASLAAGSVIHLFGWNLLLLAATPLLLLMAGALVWLASHRSTLSPVPAGPAAG